ncbi:MAG: hypothetical protein PHQ23_07700 [Candidatus Wallbacteria bacterium]|nr:hypothetical protein [Candidatus Wallbacteria bacterium]
MKNKKFDSVRMMRDARDKLSSDLLSMTPSEWQAYVKSALAEKKTRPARKSSRTSAH